MKKFLFFLPLFLLAFKFPDFSVCYKKYSFINNIIPVTKTKSVTFSKLPGYIYYDPFTHIYVIKSKNKNVIKFFSFPKLGWWMAGIKNNSVCGGTFAKKGYFLNFSKLSVNVEKNSVISDLFCRAYGVGNGGFLDKKRLMHFVKYGYWGDVGINVDKNMVVLNSDPFYTKIKPGEKILMINSKKATPEIFTDFVLLGKKGQYVSIKTDKSFEKLKIRKKIYHFTPLKYFGIEINRYLTIVKLPKWIKNKYYLKGGKIIKINNKKIDNFNTLKYALSFYKNVTITVKYEGVILTIPLRK